MGNIASESQFLKKSNQNLLSRFQLSLWSIKIRDSSASAIEQLEPWGISALQLLDSVVISKFISSGRQKVQPKQKISYQFVTNLKLTPILRSKTRVLSWLSSHPSIPTEKNTGKFAPLKRFLFLLSIGSIKSITWSKHLPPHNYFKFS